MIVFSPSIFQMTFLVRPHSKIFLRSFESYAKRWYRLALSIFNNKSTVLISRNSVRTVNVFCSADNSIGLHFPLVSCNPFKRTVLILVGCSIPFSFSTKSLFCSIRFVIHCADTSFFKTSIFAKFSSELQAIFFSLLCFTGFALMSTFSFTKVIWAECKSWNAFKFAQGNRMTTNWISSNIALGDDFCRRVFRLSRYVLISSSMRLKLSCSNPIGFCTDEFSLALNRIWRTCDGTEIICVLNWNSIQNL